MVAAVPQVQIIRIDAAEAVQTIAALERRILELRLAAAPAWQISDCQSAVIRLRAAFTDWPQPSGPTELESRALYGDR